MEKIIQIAVDDRQNLLTLTNKGQIFFKKAGEVKWKEISLPPLHTNEIGHESKRHSCSQCVTEDEPFINDETDSEYRRRLIRIALRIPRLRNYCEVDCDCPTCHNGLGNKGTTEVEDCFYCQKEGRFKGEYKNDKRI